jgi:hypothetical protein
MVVNVARGSWQPVEDADDKSANTMELGWFEEKRVKFL